MSTSDPVVVRARGVLRSDVRRNRQALLAAARVLFAASEDVPMYEVAKLAGVGQATLYRHFPDRADLAAAVLAELVAEHERLADEISNEPDAFFRLLRHIVEQSADSLVFNRMLRESAHAEAQYLALKNQLLAVFAGPLRDAKLAGTVRADLSLDDVLLMMRMMLGALDDAAPDPKPQAGTGERVFELLVHGVQGPNF